MAIEVTCPDCFASYRVQDRFAGRSVPCKTCGTTMDVPRARRRQAPVSESDDRDLRAAPRRAGAPAAKSPARHRSRGQRSSAKTAIPPWLLISGGVLLVLFVAGVAILVSIPDRGADERAEVDSEVDSDVEARASKAIDATAQSPEEPFPVQEFPPAFIQFENMSWRMVGNPPVCHAWEHRIPFPSTQPGSQMHLRIYLPYGPDEVGQGNLPELPCVLVPPAGSNLLTGMSMDEPLDNPEHLPYVQAGFAVVTFSLDGHVSNPQQASDAEFAAAYRQFQGVHGGLGNVQSAWHFARMLDMVDHQRIYIAGHSSAGTLALLSAAHLGEKLAGCIAFAPETDVEASLGAVVNELNEQQFPDVSAFLKRSSPRTHLERINCPVFVFHARGDTVVPFARTKQFCDDLTRTGKNVTFVEGRGSDHYQTMVNEGIPQALNWLASAAAMPSRAEQSTVAQGNASRPDGAGSASGGDTQAASTSAETSGNSLPSGDGRPADPPVGTKPIDTDTPLAEGRPLFARLGKFRWEAATVQKVFPGGNVEVDYEGLNDRWDAVLLRSQIRLPMTAADVPQDQLRTLEWEIFKYENTDHDPRPGIESELRTRPGYIHNSLQIDLDTRRVKLLIVRGSEAETSAGIALLTEEVFARPLFQNNPRPRTTEPLNRIRRVNLRYREFAGAGSIREAAEAALADVEGIAPGSIEVDESENHVRITVEDQSVMRAAFLALQKAGFRFGTGDPR